jgi:hypothetical protein
MVSENVKKIDKSGDLLIDRKMPYNPEYNGTPSFSNEEIRNKITIIIIFFFFLRN